MEQQGPRQTIEHRDGVNKGSKQEEEADRLGQQYVAEEGWDPAALAETMDALSAELKLSGGDPAHRRRRWR